MAQRRFHVASDAEIRTGRVTDVYFQRTEEAIRAADADKRVVGEVRAARLPDGWRWAVLAGMDEVLTLAEGWDARVWGMSEGEQFRAGEPVLTIEGRYGAFGRFETTFLGMLCHASGVATVAARCRVAAGERTVLSFGARRMHPAIAPMIERAAYIGGCDGVSTILAAEVVGIEPSGTMPHALVLLLGDTVRAAQVFDEVAPPEARRIVLIDTFQDEKFEALRVAEAMGDRLYGVRLDTPGSRRGDLAEILREVRWELDLRGYHHVKLMASGGLDPEAILALNDVCDGYGVGTSISNAPTVNFAFDIVEIEGVPTAKRGKRSGGKFVAACRACGERETVYWEQGRASPGTCGCGGEREFLNRLLVDSGGVAAERPTATEIRDYALQWIGTMSL